MRWLSLPRKFHLSSGLSAGCLGWVWIALSMSSVARADIRCQETQSMRSPVYDGAQSFGVLTRCHDSKNSASREFYVLRTEGPFATHQYLHGALLGDLVDRAVQPKTTGNSLWIDEQDQSIYQSLAATVRCVQEQIRSSAPVEWRRAYQLFNFGYGESKTKKGFSPTIGLLDFESWQMAPEIYRALEHYFGSMNEGAYANSVIAHCVGALDTGKRNRLREIVGRLERSAYRVSTDAILTPPHLDLGTPLYHGANFSVAAESDPRNSTLLLSIVHEGRDYLRYLGISRVGDSSPASLGGWNERGLSVTLHRAPVEQGEFGGFRSERAPGAFIAHQILRSAGTVDQALAIAGRIFPYNSWTLTVAQPETGDMATIEVSPKGSVVSRRTQSRYLVQTEQLFSPLVLQGSRYESYDELMASRSRQTSFEREARAVFQTGAAFRIEDFVRFFDPVRSENGASTVTGSILGRIGQFAQVVMAPSLGRIWVGTVHAQGLSGSNDYSELQVDLKFGVVNAKSILKTSVSEGLVPRLNARRFAAQAALEPVREARINSLNNARNALTMGDQPDEFSLDYALARLLFERNGAGDLDRAILLLQGKWGESDLPSVGDAGRRSHLVRRTLYLMDPIRFASLKSQLISEFLAWGQNPHAGAVQSEIEAWVKKMEMAPNLTPQERFSPFDFGQVE